MKAVGSPELLGSSWRAGKPPLLVRWTLGYIHIVRRTDLLHSLLDTLLGMSDAVGEFAGVGDPKSARCPDRHIIRVQSLEPEIDRARQPVRLVRLHHGCPMQLKALGQPRLARPADEPRYRG